MFERGFDQAQGLRQLFAQRTVHLVPVLSNPHAAGACRLLDGLCQAFAVQGLRTLVVDAATSPTHDPVGLAGALTAGAVLQPWMEPVDAHTTLLAVGDALRHAVCASQASDALFEAFAHTGPSVDVILFHADALTLSTLFAQRLVRPLVLSGDSPASLTHAYAGLKLLVQHGGLRHHAVLMDTAAPRRGLPVAASRLQQCAAEFLRARVEAAAVVCSNADGDTLLARTLRQVSLGLLQFALPLALPELNRARWQRLPVAPQPSGCALNF